jgi:hypothetical protein
MRKTKHFAGLIGAFSLSLLVVFGSFYPGAVEAASPLVVPINWGLFTSGRPTDANSVRIGTILNHTNKYALTTWYDGVKNFDAQTGAYLNFGGISESNIRPSASEGLALAASIQTGLYDPAITGVSLATAKARATKLIRSVAYRHKVNIAGGWGDQWQSPLFAAYAGHAGWLMWDDPGLSSNDRQDIRQMVEYEANRYIGYRVPYYKDAAGTLIYPGDSKAEENAWNAMLLQTATAMMPDHANYDAWNYKNHELMVSAFARPANVGSGTIVNGRSLAHWLYGSNANNDGTVINHDILHPDYMTTMSENHHAGLVNSLAGKPTPTAAFVGSDVTYDGLVDLNFVAGSAYPPGPAIAAPGGTIYRDGSSSIYYPQGNDWGTARRMHFALNDVQSKAFGFDNLASQKGDYWEPYHAQAVLDMQYLHVDRRTYATATQDDYSGREEWVAAHAAQAYLTKWIVHQGAFSKTNTATPIVIDNIDREFTMSGGTWTLASPGDRLGPNVRYTAAGTGSVKGRFTPRITTAGNYRVSAWWTAFPNHATNAPYTIRHSTGAAVVPTNQEANGGQWRGLGTYHFNAGTGGYVELSNNANEYVTADAVKFELVP